MLPVVDITFEPKLANSVVTLMFEYWTGSPVSCDPLPKKYVPATLAVVMMLLVLLPDAKKLLTSALPYVADKPVSCEPLPRI